MQSLVGSFRGAIQSDNLVSHFDEPGSIEADDLGPVLAIHRFGGEDILSLIIAWLQITAVMAAIFLACFFGERWLTHTALEGVGMILAMAVFLGLAAFGVGGAVAIFIRISARQFICFLMRGDYVARHEKGIAAVQGGKLVRLSWSEVHQLSEDCQFTGRGFYRVLAKRYDLVALDGRRIILEHFLTDLEPLVAAIRKEMFPILLQRAVADLVTSKWVSFGWLSLHVDQGIQVLQETVPWGNLVSYEVASGWLHLSSRNGQPLSVACANIANLDIALFLLERHWRAENAG